MRKCFEMTSSLNEELVQSLITKVNLPLVFRKFVKNWEVCQWNEEKWSLEFGNREIPFRCMKKNFISEEPCWERQCNVQKMTFKSFIDQIHCSTEWMYFDYKYLHQWFTNDSDLCKVLSWKQFGFPNKGASDTTLWVGSKGAHTPAHQDTYGVNIVAQVLGKKRWIFFPPETGGMKATRVPYEESSVYSELNFYCPSNLDAFNGVTGAHMVELNAGDALLVPHGWWHYVQNIDPLNIALNTWLPHEKDSSAQVSEALIKIFVAQICKDLPHETARLIVNPNEDDISDTPLTVLFLQLETVANMYLDSRRKARRAKRQKTSENNPPAPTFEDFDLTALLENDVNNLEVAPSITNEDLIKLLKENIREFVNTDNLSDDDDVDGLTSNLCLTKAVIDAFSEPNVIELVKQNLFARLNS